MSVDARGPWRVISEAASKTDGNYYLLDCGHVAIHAPHFSLNKVGEPCRCFHCGQLEIAKAEGRS